MDIEEKIRLIEEEIRSTPYNKATQHHVGKLKAKLAKLKDEKIQRLSKKKGRKFAIKKSGDATVVLVGYPSVGKSTLLNRVTEADSKVDSYAFTTMEVIPGMLEYKGAMIQIFDVPGLIEGASTGRGRGREVISVIRNADLILIMVDSFDKKQFEAIKKELHETGVRINEDPPDVKIKKLGHGGIRVNSTKKLKELEENTILSVLREYDFHNAEITIRENVTLDRLIDAVIGNRVYIQSLVVLNKMDLLDDEEIKKIASEIYTEAISISALQGTNVDILIEEIYRRLKFIRVFLKPQRGEVDYEEPLILKEGSTVRDACKKIHRDFIRKFSYAQIWGSVKFDGQRVGLDQVLYDNDVLSVKLKR